ncbi:MAG: hypothetical protein ACM3ST_05890 [Bdellovibrio bacteriovorus]
MLVLGVQRRANRGFLGSRFGAGRLLLVGELSNIVAEEVIKRFGLAGAAAKAVQDRAVLLGATLLAAVLTDPDVGRGPDSKLMDIDEAKGDF